MEKMIYLKEIENQLIKAIVNNDIELSKKLYVQYEEQYKKITGKKLPVNFAELIKTPKEKDTKYKIEENKDDDERV